LGAVQNGSASLFRQVLPGRLQVEAHVVRQRAQAVPVEDLAAVRARSRPWGDGAARDGEGVVRDDQLRVELLQVTEARAVRAGAVRRVEREGPRLELLEERAVLRAGEALAEQLVRAGDTEQDTNQPL